MPVAQRSTQPPATITPSVRKDRGASKARCPKRERCPVPLDQREKGTRRLLSNGSHNLPQSKRAQCARTEGQARRVARSSRCYFPRCPKLDKVLGAFGRSEKGARRPLLNARHNLPQSKRVRCAREEGHAMHVARSEKGARRLTFNGSHHLPQSKRARCARTEGHAMRVARSSTLPRQLHGKPRGALGRRVREADPDSRSVSERGERAVGPESSANK